MIFFTRFLGKFLLLAAFTVLLDSCASSKAASKADAPAEETFLERARQYQVSAENEDRLSWQNYLFALDALEAGDYLLARHHLDRSLHMLVAEKHEEPPRADDSVYRWKMIPRIMEGLDAIYPNLGIGSDASSYFHYDFSLEGLDYLDEPALDSTERVEIENFLDTLDFSRFSLPIELNERVMREIHFLSKTVPYFTESSLSRKTAYDSMITARLKENQMPPDLIYLPLVESGYKLKAYSRAKASGLWQFVPATGKSFGLDSDYWVDMRRNPERATEAGVAYLTYLYKEFGDWLLAMAAYNCGEGRVRRLLREARADSLPEPITYWDLKLPKETMHYVPRILAAMIIGHFPEHYGFKVEKQTRTPFDTVTVNECVPLAEVAPVVGITIDELQDLNIELLKQTTPPTYESYTLRIPAGTREVFLEAYEKMDKSKWSRWDFHKVKKGETLSAIGRKYGLSAAQILSANALKTTKLSVGQSLLIPLPSKTKAAPKPANEQLLSRGNYLVKKGENLATIARRFGISAAQLREWNSLGKNSSLRAGQMLLLKKPKELPREYQVKAGDTYQSIADSFDISFEELMKLNNASRKRLVVGQTLKIAPEETARPQPLVVKRDSTHKVASGETLTGIAKLYGATVTDLRNWNGLETASHIRTGQILRVTPPETSRFELIPPERPGPETPNTGAPVRKILYHTVKTGESLWDIARSYGVTIQQIVEWNKLEDTKVKVGARLEIRRELSAAEE